MLFRQLVTEEHSRDLVNDFRLQILQAFPLTVLGYLLYSLSTYCVPIFNICYLYLPRILLWWIILSPFYK